MALDNRIAPVAAGARFLALGALAAACCGCMANSTAEDAPQAPDEDAAATQTEAANTDPVPILVMLSVDPDGDMATVRDRLLKRLRPMLTPAQFDTVQRYEAFPMLALTAPPKAIAWLLTQDEVASVELNREHKPAGGATLSFPGRPSAGAAEDADNAPADADTPGTAGPPKNDA